MVIMIMMMTGHIYEDFICVVCIVDSIGVVIAVIAFIDSRVCRVE